MNDHVTRQLTPAQDRAIKAAIRAGVPSPQLAREYGVTRRTIWRAAHRAVDEAARTHVITVGAWRTTYVERDDAPPARVEPWRAVV